MADPINPHHSPSVQTPVPTDTAQELSHVTQEIYKKNLELAEKNKTLSLLRKIDEIVLGSVTDTKEFAQKVIDTLVQEGDVKHAVIYLLDTKNDLLRRVAFTQTEELLRSEAEYNRPLHNELIPTTHTDNLIVISLLEKKMQMTNNLYDIMLTEFTDSESAKVQEILGITKILIYPLLVRQEVLGVMVVGTDEKDELLATYRKDLTDRLAVTVGIAIDNALLYQNIQEANHKLKELDKMKDEFVSLASHELRTPMTAIKSYIWMLLEQKLIQDPKGLEYLHHAYEVTDRLISLVNDMLNVSRIESGRMVITPVTTSIAQVIQDVVAEVSPAADKQSVTIEILPHPSDLPQVLADVNKIKEVIINLIGNSIKFTPPGGKITISTAVDNMMVITSIKDTGKGLLPEDIQHLFTKFGMLEKNYTAKNPAEGSGLGLYICKSIIELHGGKIAVTSEGTDKGTTFSFSLKSAM